jgi:hypothetical protein
MSARFKETYAQTVYVRNIGNARRRAKEGKLRCEICESEPGADKLYRVSYAQERDNGMMTVCHMCTQMAITAAQGDTNFEMQLDAIPDTRRRL